MLKKRWGNLASLGAVALLAVLSVAFAACGGAGDGASAAGDDVREGEAAHMEGDVVVDTGEASQDAADAAADHEGDEAAHMEGDEMDSEDMADADDPNAYLEAAPKDSLFLVEMTSFAFTPSVLEVEAGEVVEIAIQNGEPLLHDFTIDEVDADVHISYLGGTGQHMHAEPERDADLHFALTEPASGVVHIKFHEPGEYVFYCTVPGHREAGMEGTLIVR